MKKHGHYCKICGEYKSNEKFSGKGHAAHICKACSKLPAEKRSEMMILNKLLNLPWRLSKEQKTWLKNKTHDRRPEIKALAQEQYDIRFNPNACIDAIEGITSPDGRVLGKMAHSERIGNDITKNVPGNKDQHIFRSGVEYFTK